MASALVPLAQGCEELEAVTVIDLLRRAGIEVVTAGLDEGPVQASRGVVLIPDTQLDAVMGREFDMIVLPGGLPASRSPYLPTTATNLKQPRLYRGNLCCPQGAGGPGAAAGETGHRLSGGTAIG